MTKIEFYYKETANFVTKQYKNKQYILFSFNNTVSGFTATIYAINNRIATFTKHSFNCSPLTQLTIFLNVQIITKYIFILLIQLRYSSGTVIISSASADFIYKVSMSFLILPLACTCTSTNASSTIT